MASLLQPKLLLLRANGRSLSTVAARASSCVGDISRDDSSPILQDTTTCATLEKKQTTRISFPPSSTCRYHSTISANKEAICTGSTAPIDCSASQTLVGVESTGNASCADKFAARTAEPEPVLVKRTAETAPSHSDHYNEQRRWHGNEEKPEGVNAKEKDVKESAYASASAQGSTSTSNATVTDTNANAGKAPSSSSPPLRSGSSIEDSRKERAMRIYNKIMFLPRNRPLDQSMVVAAEGCLDELARLPPSGASQDRNSEANAGANDNPDESPADVAIKLFQRLKDQSVTLTGQMYEYTIQALAKQRDRVSEADSLLTEYIGVWEGQKRHQHKSNHGHKRGQHPMKPPNSILISSVINAHAKDQDNFNAAPAQRAEHLLRTMARLHDDYADADDASPFAPNTISFTSVIDAWSRRRYAPKAERLLNWMEEYGASHDRTARADAIADEDVPEHPASHVMGYGPVSVQPNTSTYNAVVAAWSRAATNAKRNEGTTRNIDRTEAAKNAESMLYRMIDTPGVQPDAITYASVLSAWANSPQQPHGAGRADDILLQMEHTLDDAFTESFASASPYAAIPNVVCYNTVLHGWSNANNPQRAEEVLCRMVERNERYPLVAPAPNVASFNLTALAWARSGRKDAGRKAQDLLEAMEGMASATCGAAATSHGENKSDVSNIRPDVVTYNTVLDGWFRGSTIEDALCAEELLDSMERGERAVKPDVISFNLVIGAWAKAGEETSRRRQQRQGNNRRSHGTSHIMSNSSVNTAERAEEILHRMDVAGVQPDTISFNSCISAWSKSGRGTEAADRAEALLLAMEELHKQGKKRGRKSNTHVHPDAVTYSAVINAIAQSGDRDAPFRAEAVLARMETMAVFRRSTAKPNTWTYNGILNCWAKSASDVYEAAQKADDILSRMEEGGHNMPAPDSVSYCTVINAWSRSSNPDKATKARQVLDRMMTMTESVSSDRNGINTARYVRNAHNMVLSCCAYTPREADRQTRETARQIAIQTYEDIHSPSCPVQPDDVTYSNFLLVCSHLFGRNSLHRERLLDAVLTDCCDRNLVTDRVLGRMERVVSGELREKVLARIDNDT